MPKKRENTTGLRSSYTTPPPVNKSPGFGLGPGLWKINDAQFVGKLTENLHNMQKRGELTDVTFVFEEKEISANRSVLAAVSPVLCQVLKNRDGYLNPNVIGYQELLVLITFIYSAQTKCTLEEIALIENAAQLLKIEILVKACQSILTSINKRTNAMEKHLTSLHEFDKNSLHESKQSLCPTSPSHLSRQVTTIENADRCSSIKIVYHSRKDSNVSKSIESFKSLGDHVTPAFVQTTEQNIESNSQRLATEFLKIDIPTNSARTEELLLNDSSFKKRSNSYSCQGKRFKSPNYPTISDELNLMKSGGTWPRSGQLSRQNSGSLVKVRLFGEECEENLPNKAYKKTTKDKVDFRFQSKGIPNLLPGLNHLREQQLFCDLVLIVGTSRIPCHRVIIAASSHVFHAILSRIKSNEIVLTKIDEKSFPEIIRYIYSSQCSIDKENVMNVMRTANRFKFEFVVEQCAKYVDKHCLHFHNFFTVENVLIAYKIAKLYSCQRMYEESRKLAISRFFEVIAEPPFKELSPLELNRLISNDYLRIARLRNSELEYSFYKAIVDWLTHKLTQRVPLMTSRMMKFVNFSNMKIDFIRQVVMKETVVVLDQDTRQRVLGILRTQILTVTSQSPSRPSINLLSNRRHDSVGLMATSRNVDKKIRNDIYCLGPPVRRMEQYKSNVTLPIRRNYCVASMNGCLFVVGGISIDGDKSASSDVYKYDNFQWFQLSSMKIARSNFALVPLFDNLYAVGGLTGSSESIANNATDTIEQFDMSKAIAKWKIMPQSLTCPSFCHAASPCTVNVLQNAAKNKNRMKPTSPGRRKTSFRFGRGDSPSRQFTTSSAESADSLLASAELVSHFVMFICGGMTNPTQNIMYDFAEKKFYEKSSLPLPSPNPTMTSSSSYLFLLTYDVTDGTDSLKMFKYDAVYDHWMRIYHSFKLDFGLDVKPVADDCFATNISCFYQNKNVYVAAKYREKVSINSYNLTSLCWNTSRGDRDVMCEALELHLCAINIFKT